MLGIKWNDKVMNLKFLDRTGLTSIGALALRMQLQLTGPVIDMDVAAFLVSCSMAVIRSKQPSASNKVHKDIMKDDPYIVAFIHKAWMPMCCAKRMACKSF